VVNGEDSREDNGEDSKETPKILSWEQLSSSAKVVKEDSGEDNKVVKAGDCTVNSFEILSVV
jgi:hypothetical protein